MGDLDGDGLVDLLSRSGASIRVAFGAETYSTWRVRNIFDPANDLPVSSDEVLIGDFDGDRFGDLMRRRPSGTTAVWKFNRGVSDGTFGATESPLFGDSNIAYARDLTWAIGDFNADGRADVLLRYDGSGLFWVSRNLTERPGTTPVFYGGFNPLVGGSYYAYRDEDRLVAMDVNGDGRDDIVVRRPSNNEWITSTNVADWSFNGGISMSIGGSAYAYEDSDIIGGALP